ncbi:MAG: TIGR02117 family protein [Hymenobacteraceae bacterium]|nr:TIGR02117 family protein [Hymenobacteraceae bacterium]
MRRIVANILSFILWALGTIAALTALFFLAAFVLGSVTVNSSYAQASEDSVEIFITSNGVHTDIVVPVSTPHIDWRSKIPLHHFADVDSSYTHLSFGWGDRRFYMQTPEWSDLTPGVALSAALWPTPTAMHVEYISSRLEPNRQQLPIRISAEQYRQLIAYIDGSFQKENGTYRHIPDTGYSETDTFYEAHGRFYALKNCNNWVNQGLKTAELRSALWAPIPYAVMRHYR